MIRGGKEFDVRFARTREEIEGAQALRYAVFVEELGGAGGDDVDHRRGLERDRFDPHCTQLILTAPGAAQVLGVYRLMTSAQAQAAGQFYSETEFDLGPLKQRQRPMLELGRSCLHPQLRGGDAMLRMWMALARYAVGEGIEVLFGSASFHGTDPRALVHPLAQLYHNHLAPAPLRPRARATQRREMSVLPASKVDRRRAMLEMPALIKAYLRLGGWVGDGAWVDAAFNTTDICVILDTAQINPRQRALLLGRSEDD